MPILQVQPTNTKPIYKDPRAGILSGAGNSQISDALIKKYVSKPGLTPDKALKDVLAYGVSAEQFSRASGIPIDTINKYAKSKGISYEQEMPEPLQFEVPQAEYKPAAFVPASQDPVKGTVSGQLDSILSNPDSPLLKRAETYANQQSNKRGLLNSSIGTTAAQSAITDAGLQIATPDAQSNNEFALYNAGEQNQSNRFNSQLGAQVGMANAGIASDVLRNRESLSAGILNNRESLANNLAIANLDTNTKLAVADLQARSEDSKFAASLYDTLLKLQENINSNPDMTPDDKARYFGDLVKTLTSGVNLLDTFASADLGDLNFGSSQQSSGSTNNTSQNTVNNNQQSVSILPDGDSSPITNINGRIIDGFQKNSIQNFNANRGTNFDPRYLVAPEEMEGMTFQQKSEKFIPLPNYDAEGNLKQDTAFFHKP